MTHTLHRRGPYESLEDDYVVFAISAQEVNAKGTASLFADFFKVVKQYNYKNLGDMKTGNMYSVGVKKIEEEFQDNSIVHAVFDERKEVVKVLKELKDKDLGLSIVVSGLIDSVEKICKESGTEFHTVNNSLGIWGNTNRLPREEVLQISTMCGHGMVSFNLVQDLAQKVKNNKLNIDKAVNEITKQCHCGVINPVRTKRLIEEML
ncbi:hypothetical protein [Halanaerobium sp. MA284_MarDTE_T2]|uniref:hypothetical protein n=1 Tax=Halanaerobium sp. MA284_MarDTE_T2 TaxID=2183913 RepID=UPI000DF437D4|nr:hypothetical protein [Halanaerobium sp. MA284_MarDTE_T2]RCW48640.1 hypothetical protein DFR78_10822 [Halanaerobium sp. MA284_MarDTE_T2]